MSAITREVAHSIAEAYLNRPASYRESDLRFVILEIKERDSYWLVYFDSAAHVASQSVSDAIAGNGPLLVSKANGAVVSAGTAAPIADRIAEAEWVLHNLSR